MTLNHDSLRFTFLLIVSFALFLLASESFASDAMSNMGGAGMQWESTLEKVRRSFSGPVASSVALLGLISVGGTLVWGGDLSEFSRRVIYAILAICIVVFANSLITGTLFAGATIPAGFVL